MRTRPFALMACVVLAGCAAARAGLVVETWGGEGRFAHAKTLTVTGDGKRISVDLSALPGATKVSSARLVCFRKPPAGHTEEARIKVQIVPAGGGQPLRLVAPWYDAFAVPASAVKGGKTLSFEVSEFPGWVQEETFLEVSYDGKPAAALPAVTNVAAMHRAGQTFITWTEIDKAFSDALPTLAQLTKAREALAAKRRVRYRIYRHDKPIDAGSIAGARLLAVVEPLSGYNVRGVSLNRLIYQHQLRALKDPLFARSIARGPFRGYHPGMPQMGQVVVDRLAVEDGKPLGAGTGLYVHHPAKEGKAYYAVVVCVDGRANTAALGKGASLAKPVAEATGTGTPVFQGIEQLKVFYDYPGQRRRYVQWTAPPLSNLPNQYYNWGVYVPAARGGAQEPLALGIYFHDWKALYLKPSWPHRRDMVLIATNDAPWASFGYGYHESLGTLRSLAEGAVHDYTARRIDEFVKWVRKAFPIDAARMSCHGQGSLGGTSALHYALRHPTRFALVVTGFFDADPKSSPAIAQIDRRRVRTHLRSLEAVWGKKEWDLKTAGGKSIWQDRDLVAFVGRNAKLALPFMSLGTGSQHHTWPQETDFMKALWKAKQPFCTDFTWGGQAPRFGWLEARRDSVILAAVPTKEALAKTPWYKHARWQKAAMGYWGGGTIGSGAVPTDVVDTQDRLELTAQIFGNVTVRNAQQFKLAPGENVRWQVKTGRRNDPSGVATADANGLLTIAGLSLRGKLIVTRMTAEPAKTAQGGKEGITK